MKKFLLSCFLLGAFTLPAIAQSGAQVDKATKSVLGSRPKDVTPVATLSRGIIGLNGSLSVKTNVSGNLVITNPTNGFTHTIVFPVPTANRTTTFPIAGGTVSTSPSVLTYQFTGASFNTVVTQVEPTVGSTVITLPDTADVDVAIPFSTLATNSLTAANSIWFESSAIAAEGATADGNESRLTFPDVTGDVNYAFLELTAGTYPVVYSTLATNKVGAANAIWLASNSLVWECATADAFEGTDTPADVTADRTWTKPDATGTYMLGSASTTTALTADNQVVTPGSNRIIQLSSDNATATNRTFTLSATGAITGWDYVIIGPATNQCEIADTGIQVLSATWSPTAGDTLTLHFDGTSFIEVARAVNH